MIKVQLCPSGELENKNWWVADACVFVLIAFGGYVLMEQYFDGVRTDITRLQEKKVHWEQELASKQTGIEKFKNLNTEIDLLKRKIGALSKITTSKIDKIKPLIALDQLQTLWMEGVWYEDLTYSSTGNVDITASAHDSILVGEYMLGLRETMNPDTKNDDLRTQIGFDSLSLKNATLNASGDEIFRDIKKKMNFKISASHLEKQTQPAQAASVTLGPRPRALTPSSF
jgi:hypothetical protein